MAKKASAAPVAKKVETTKQFPTLEEALNFIDALRKKKVTGYLNVGSWSVRWKA